MAIAIATGLRRGRYPPLRAVLAATPPKSTLSYANSDGELFNEILIIYSPIATFDNNLAEDILTSMLRKISQSNAFIMFLINLDRLLIEV
jgi:hypothetical protein